MQQSLDFWLLTEDSFELFVISYEMFLMMISQSGLNLCLNAIFHLFHFCLLRFFYILWAFKSQVIPVFASWPIWKHKFFATAILCVRQKNAVADFVISRISWKRDLIGKGLFIYWYFDAFPVFRRTWEVEQFCYRHLYGVAGESIRQDGQVVFNLDKRKRQINVQLSTFKEYFK